jgi:hypothetical protein
MKSLTLFLVLSSVLGCRTDPQNKGSGIDTGTVEPGETGEWGPVDADGDGFTSDEDCDDTNAAIHPDAAEICNGVDDNCDGDTDDADAALDTSTATDWYADTDSDSFGDPDAGLLLCEMPTGYVADNTDCDDTVNTTYPGADEYCDGVDSDCDGILDEDDALDALTWYVDADNDTFGHSSSTYSACEQPSGYVADDTDCDDSDPSVYPGARERKNGVDDDCDGLVDDEWWIGTGSDGALSVSAPTNLSDSGAMVATAVTAINGTEVRVDSTSGLAVGDEVLLINMHGSDAAHAAVGVYELIEISAVSADTVTLLSPVSGIYGESSNSDLTGQTVVLQRVPQYTDVTVASGGSLSVNGWDDATGGILAFRATGTVNVESGGLIVGDGGGYAGGATGSAGDCDAFQGESFAGEGEGEGDGACIAYNEDYGQWENNYGGGGAHVTGGGGGYGEAGQDGDSWTGGSATAPYGGAAYGNADLSTLFLGSGGGGVWYGGNNPGPGGDGAGMIFIAALSIETAAEGAISAIGDSTSHWSTGTWTYGAGGGSGGSIYLMADTLMLTSESVVATGGLGEQTHIRLGGDGAVGRIRLDYNTLNGAAFGSATSEEENAAEPDVGYSDSP